MIRSPINPRVPGSGWITALVTSSEVRSVIVARSPSLRRSLNASRNSARARAGAIGSRGSSSSIRSTNASLDGAALDSCANPTRSAMPVIWSSSVIASGGGRMVNPTPRSPAFRSSMMIARKPEESMKAISDRSSTSAGGGAATRTRSKREISSPQVALSSSPPSLMVVPDADSSVSIWKLGSAAT